MKKLIASKYWWLFLLIFFFGVNLVASIFHSRFDLTKEKRYTLSGATKKMLSGLQSPVTVDVFLKGEFPAGFKKLANGVQEFLQECKEYGKDNLRFRFIDPFKIANDSAENFLKETRALILRDSTLILRDTTQSFLSQARLAVLSSKNANTDKEIVEEFATLLMDSLQSKYDLTQFKLQAPGKVGDEQVEKQVMPGALIHYNNSTAGVNLLKGQKSYGTTQEELAALYNDVEATLEYKFASAVEKITSTRKPRIGYLLGNGEAWGPQVDDAVRTLIHNYRFDTVNIRTRPYIDDSSFNALVIIKPTIAFTDADKFKLDQYVMHGGKLFWMIDNMYAELDSLAKSGGFIAYDRALNLEDMLFRYGVRLNQNLLQDMQSDKLPKMSGDPNNKPTLVDWPYFPVLNGTDHPISKNLDGVRAIFPNTLDTVKADGIKKTFLLRSSVNARVLAAPARVDFEYMQIAPDIKQFSIRDTTVAALLEGKFKSLYAGRIPTSLADTMKAYGATVKTVCETDTKMIVVADGDVATNFISQQYGPLPMGFNLYTRYTFANKDFFTNGVEYLVDSTNILETRAKNFTLRLLNPRKVKEQKPIWQFVNIGLPVILIIIIALIYQQTRRRKYGSG